MLNIEGKLVSVVGGGEVALRKVKGLLEHEAHVRVISPQFIGDFINLSGNLELIRECYREELIKESFMVIAATSSKEVNLRIEGYCKENRILCSIADDMKLSDFILPSTIRRGSLVISVSTEGKSPAFASKIKKEIEERYPDEYAAYVDILGEIRELIQSRCSDISQRKKLLREVIGLSMEELVRRRDELEISSRF
jgi:precorrin-2 dehydrogenase / sirohydrochlorin ferrochelatase